jgi:sugar lactone lactonase YvrE
MKSSESGSSTVASVRTRRLLLVADRDAFGGFLGGVIRVDPLSGAQTTVSADGSFVNPSGVALDADGDILVADPDTVVGSSGRVTRVDPASGVQTTVSEGGTFVDPTGVALEADGDILVADARADLIRVDPTAERRRRSPRAARSASRSGWRWRPTATSWSPTPGRA